MRTPASAVNAPRPRVNGHTCPGCGTPLIPVQGGQGMVCPRGC